MKVKTLIDCLMMSTTLLYNQNLKRKKVRQKPVLKFPTSDDKQKATDPERETNSKDERRETTNYKLTSKSSYRNVPTKQLKGKNHKGKNDKNYD